MERRIRQLEEQVALLRRTVQRISLENAIHDEIPQKWPLDALCSYLGCRFYSDALILAVIHARADPPVRPNPLPVVPEGPYHPGNQTAYYSDKALEAAEQLFLAAFSPKTQCIVFRADQDIGLLLNPDCKYVMESSLEAGRYYRELVEAFPDLLAQLNCTLGFESVVTISGLHRKTASLRQMYLETKTAHDYSWNRPGSVHAFPDHPSVPLSRADQKELGLLEQEFLGDVNHLLFFEASVVLDQILQLQLSHAQPLEDLILAMTARLRNVTALLESTSAMGTAQRVQVEQLITEIAQSGSIPELQDRLHDFFITLSDMNPRQSMSKGALVLEFIETNYKNPMLGAQMICDRFRISAAYLSTLIKRETGQGLVNTIHEIRVAHAKALLAETGISVEQVALQTGFANRYGLIRAFRSLEGISPSEYRKQAAADSG